MERSDFVPGQKSGKKFSSIWNTERLIFGYYEKEDDAELNA